MRIVIASAVYAPMINGVAVFAHNLAIGLARRGHEVIVLTPSQTKKAYNEVIDGVRVYFLKSRSALVYPDQIHLVPPKRKIGSAELPRVFYRNSLKVSIFPMKEIKEILDDFKPDVIHIQVSDPIGVAVLKYARKNKIPVVNTEHNQPDVFTETLHLPKVIKNPANKILSKYFLSRQTKADYVTMPTQRSIENLFHDKKINIPVEAVSNGVDLTNYKPGKCPDEIYDKYNVPKGVPIVLYVGRVDPEKSIEKVIKGFQLFLKHNKDSRLAKAILVIVGDGVDKSRLVRLVSIMKMQDNVRFLGRIVPPELYNIYKMGDVFVTASEIETQGIVLIEAAATGLPLIAVDAGAVSEVCLNLENGFLLRPGDVKAIAESINAILSDQKLRERMSKKSLIVAEENSLEKTLDKFISIYEKLVKKV